MMVDWLKRGKVGALAADVPLHSLRYVVLDTELTSLDHRTNRLLSVGAIAMQGPSIRLGEQFYRVVNPQVSIPAEGVVIHKLRPEDVERGEHLGSALEELGQFLSGALVVGHFVDIDVKVLRKEMKLTGQSHDYDAVCTARMHRWILRQGPYSEDLAVRMEQLDLPTVARFYGVGGQDDAHQALADAFLTARVWQRMMYTLQAKGIGTLKKLLRIGEV